NALTACFITRARMFFFSSRRRHTRSKRDWSSDVCSSDLAVRASGFPARNHKHELRARHSVLHFQRRKWIVGEVGFLPRLGISWRSEERRVGKECGAWWSRWLEKVKGVENLLRY